MADLLPLIEADPSSEGSSGDGEASFLIFPKRTHCGE
jgi:hypothetical protein